ncbi:MAG: hypothetical protein LQ350_000302 [Teloschistes chrysophthalmus]|nr:MAG: hypothetical protein LQ350_000302 [Niorma chrysophthalma]
MDVSHASELLLSKQNLLDSIPDNILNVLRSGTNSQYLDALAQLALSPAHTSTIFTTHHTLSVEICSRWLSSSKFRSMSLDSLAALARILPVATYLSPYAERLLHMQEDGHLARVRSGRISEIQEIPEDSLQAILLALCRLLRFDNEAFARLVSPAQLQLLLSHTHRPIRYLAVRTLCLYLHASEFAMKEMLGKYLGEGEIRGQWEEKTIDYTFFDLWETKRLEELRRSLQGAQEGHSSSTPKTYYRFLEPEDFSATTVCLGGVLLPCFDVKLRAMPSLVMTDTSKSNMQSLAEAFKTKRPVLLTGQLGVGKTSLVREAAQILGCHETMLVLHLNEQIDAKLLIGMYTTTGGPGSFRWQPGTLTKAVTEGLWVMIEDFDRAPVEIVSMLLPLLERGELLVPHWGESIRAAPGFKIIATMRTAGNDAGTVLPRRIGIGARHWQHVTVQAQSRDELGEIARETFPLLHAYLPRILSLYSRLRGTSEGAASDGKPRRSIERFHSPQDLFRWCSRLNRVLTKIGVISGNEPIPESANDEMFLEAVDCFSGDCSDGPTKKSIVDTIAQELHVSQERVSFCLVTRKPEFSLTESSLRIGRVSFSRKTSRPPQSSPKKHLRSPFATTNRVLRQLESVATCIRMAEPCLLVGETGTGKTTIIQQLAEYSNHKLVVVNLSQQSESGDLLGGFKPVNMRALAIPMRDEFSDLFESTFSQTRNQRYVEHVAKAIAKNRWSRALTLWREAAKMVESSFQFHLKGLQEAGAGPVKKRRIDSPRLQALKPRWESFAGQLEIFQKHLESGPGGFAFSFVEGNIVKAARNGDWVLLDEINLAAPDTLESLADLLVQGGDDGPSLLLTETGETTRVRAHKSFRIFGAMNPATDVGKRDLPISLRTRFTELFIDAPDKDLDNLIPLVQAYLGRVNHSDVRVASDVAQLYLEIQSLTSQNRLVDGADQKPHFSLRTLTRTLVYVLDIAPIYGLRRALFEGFSMSFLTSLNRNSSSLIKPVMEKYLLDSQKNIRATLFQTPKLPGDPSRFVKFKQYWMSRGPLPSQSQSHYIITPFIENNLLNLVRATSTRRFPVLLQGPTSSGKTSMVEYLANISGHRFVRINNHEHTDLQEYLGTYVSGPDGQLLYQEGVLVQALREGFWIVLDELNLAPTDVLEALNRLLDDNRELFIPETQQVVKPHENFMLFATQNPPGIYGGRKVLSRAFRNRFLELHFDDIPEEELEVILRERSQIAPSFCAKIVAVYKKLSLYRQQSRLYEQKNSFATLRDLFRWALRDADDREQLAVNGYYLLAERVRNDEEREVVKRTIEEVMRVSIDINVIYGARTIPDQSGLEPVASGIVWTTSMRRLYVLVTQALKSREPVLLVGETGTGKTTICQVIAAAMQNHLHMVNAHQNLETGDLIGSQRPVRSRRSIEARLHQELQSFLHEFTGRSETRQSSFGELLAAYKQLPASSLERVPVPTKQSLEQGLAQLNALFEWVDGSLVHAMKAGRHFLLDEISLADDSVLERLNSVLEPGRKLFLAEKGVDDALISAADGFQFLATMNPGGEYGKKELSPALRNRFTEVWVPPASDQSEMEEIVQEKLGQTKAQLAKPMVDFAHWYGCEFGQAATPISVRDLLAWAAFINAHCIPDEQLSILHGAALVYIDTLGANPAALLQMAGQVVGEQRQRCLNQLSELFGCDMSRLYWEAIEFMVQDENLWLGPFQLRRGAAASFDPQYSLRAPTTGRNAMKITRALQSPRPILLEGNPGVGKTTLVTALAQAIGMPLTRINLSDQTDLMDLFGSDVPIEDGNVGQFEWRDAPFLRAMQTGEWVLLDEMNLASQSILEGLNACFDHRGQVYIPELDQTFNRHPDFVVFAAQNPHHQGSGRKGLPSSFVNRFSVVYADVFDANDLLTICSEKFPSVPSDDIRLLTTCVTDLDAALHQSKRLGIPGGPWEINLRDTVRWLELLSSASGLLPAGNAEDFVSMLFQQRFRTEADAKTVRSLLEGHLPRLQNSRHRAIGIGVDHVQVGLGLLPRHATSAALVRGHHSLPFPHLPLVESIMLCVQKIWPCLLVGASRSGKTNLIQHLAGCVGADLVDFPMNADMDTTDLVGGYEQSDSLRETAAFTRRLKTFSRSYRLQKLVSSSNSQSALGELENVLREDGAKVSDIVEILRSVVDEDPNTGFESHLREGMSILDKCLADNRARFEWIDGILVRAIVEGKWLVLDNANLCSPSVLDRLNSLLEPNGVLNIAERRSADGSARIVKPSPAFRLFLTMDPQHGELSRAMRNRCIEIFVPEYDLSPASGSIDLSAVSAMARFGQFRKISSFPQEQNSEDFVWCFLDHLALSDYPLIKRFAEQVLSGLVDISSKSYHILPSVLESFQTTQTSVGGIVQRIEDMYHKVSTEHNLPRSYEGTQTIQPLNNHSLLMLSSKLKMPYDPMQLGRVLALLFEIVVFERQLMALANTASNLSRTHMSRLQRSIRSNAKQHRGDDSTKPLALFLTQSIHALRHIVDQAGESLQRANGSSLKSCLAYLVDLFDIGNSPTFDEAVFQVYLGLGRALVAELQSQMPIMTLVETLDKGLDQFNSFWQLSSGQSMELIWTACRPPTPKTLPQLASKMQTEQLADRFDKVLWIGDAPMEEMSRLRQSLWQLVANGEAGDNVQADDIIKDITETLVHLESDHIGLREPAKPYFQAEFAALQQYQATKVDTPIENAKNLLGLLAGYPIRLSLDSERTHQGWQLLSSLSKLTGIGSKENALAGPRDILPISLLRKLEFIAEVPLASLQLLQEEMTRIATHTVKLTASFDRNHVFVLNDLLKSLHAQFALAHADYVRASSFASGPWNIRDDVPTPQYLRGVLEGYLQPSWHSLTTGADSSHLRHAASAWVLFFTGSLKLYIPDHPYDPALKSKVLRDRHRKRTKELQRKLSALRHYEQLTTGQDMNMRCQLLEQDLKALGPEPTIHAVIRPEASELDQLQGEFHNILQSIVGRSPNPVKLARVFDGDSDSRAEVGLLRSNIAQAVSRVSQSFRAYEDVTKPLVAMLQGLDVGLVMAQVASEPKTDRTRAIEDICRFTPFFGMRPHIPTHREDLGAGPTSKCGYDARLKYLESVAVNNNIAGNGVTGDSTAVLKCFHALYEEWKQQLTEDQRKDMLKSSMYRYRGGETDLDAADEEEFKHLFPDYEAVQGGLEKESGLRYNPGQMAQRVAKLHINYLESKQEPADQIMDLIRKSSSDLSHLWQADLVNSRSPVTASNMLCGLIPSLDRNVDRLHSKVQAPKLYNFYTNSNMPEACRLIDLARRIQARFYELKRAWPEHATLDEVLRTCSELLAFRHTEPVAKFITKVEQLHGYIHEWQVVASREYSAAPSYEQSTALIVSWRRLELGTWARLFDMEDRRCEEEVDSWWFIAYEVIVAAPLSLVQSGDDLQQHAQELFVALQDFAINASLGHFSLRLRMLKTFQKYVALIQQSLPDFGIVQRTLCNFLNFYERYSTPILKALRVGRLALEKEIKDVLLLASWKDTNINALRDSAKRSHHKLFKVVRKYRALLARPAHQTIEQGFPANSPPSVASSSIEIYMYAPNELALRTCQDTMPWSERPPRFQNIGATISSMQSLSQTPPWTIDTRMLLDQFGIDLLEDIKLLQKETPQSATDDNAELVKHLASRKRKLFSDTLKSVRHMGFRSNLSSDVLSKQSSTAIILSRMSAIDSYGCSDAALESEYQLHHFLSQMPAIREASRTHSDDLSGSDITRSIGYLESILSYTLKQRAVSGDLVANIASLDRSLEKMQNTWKPERYELKLQKSRDGSQSQEIKAVVSSLPHIVQVGCRIIEVHGKLGNLDHSETLTDLDEWQELFTEIALALNNVPSLPEKLISSQHCSYTTQARRLLKGFSAHLHNLVHEQPNLAFVLRQVQLWTEVDIRSVNGHGVGRTSLDLQEYDQILLKLCDSILVAIQNFDRRKATIVSSDDERWLVNSEKALSDSIRALSVRSICTSIDETMSQLCQLSPENLRKATALTATVWPLVKLYRDICHEVLRHTFDRSRALHQLAATLAKSFTQIASQGFCNPSKTGPSEAGKNEKLEEGTGLGEGDGAEDISKDIQDDEDLSELAQQGQKSKEGEDIDDQEDAVNMDQEEMEGEMGDAPEHSDDEDASQPENGDDEVDEETGDVDDLDPNAVDEKFWDDDGKEAEKNKQGLKAKGPSKKNEEIGAENEQNDVDGEDAADEEVSENGIEEEEHVAQQETETMDPHAQQEENLDLPEEMDLDGPDKSTAGSDLDDGDLDGLSDAESVNNEAPGEGESDVDESKEANSGETQEATQDQVDDVPEEQETEKGEEAGSPVDTDPGSDSETDEGLLRNQTDDAVVDRDNIAPSDAQGLDGQDSKEEADIQMQENKISGSSGQTNDQASADQPQAAAKRGELGGTRDQPQEASEDKQPATESYTSQAFKKLGDALERWHRQQKKIQDAQSPPDVQQEKADVDMTDPEFEHLDDEDQPADTQALGAATEDQAHTLDQRALDSEMQEQPHDFLPDAPESDENEETAMEEADPETVSPDIGQEQPKPSTFIGSTSHGRQNRDPQGNPLDSDDDEPSTSLTLLPPTSPTHPENNKNLKRSLPSALALCLTMLEAGELCILAFGSDVSVAHPFNKPFSADSGAHVFQHFTFKQERTDILKLVTVSLDLFREARRDGAAGAGGDGMWQLGLIVGDGICEDRDAVRRLVRRGMEERVMFVFVVVDGAHSVVDMQEAVFEDSEGEGGGNGGGGKVRVRRYLDDFPFRYYVVVGDARELPGVLAQALRGWFGEIVGS